MYELLEQYYKDNYDRLVKNMTRRAGSPENAEDIVQEAFSRAMRFYDNYDDSRPFEGWFVNILNNSLREFKVSERNYGMSKQSDVEEEEADGYDSITMMHVEDIKKLIDKSGDEAPILDLHFIKGYKLIDVVRLLDDRYRHVFYVCNKFRDMVNAKYGGA